MIDSRWYKDVIIYEAHVKCFFDSTGDGIGDFQGFTMKLDYLQDLGVSCIWLLPFYPSPLRDDGYDIADYKNVHPAYGSLRDFKSFVKEAHRRGIRIITELVVNHTSDEHPWFQAARNAPAGSRRRSFYVWSKTAQRYQQARIIFTDSEKSNWTWDPVAQEYFWHRFFHHQPDLNFDNPLVLREINRVLRFWMDMGVDGMRLDAVPYLVEREGTNCENLPETHAILKEIRRQIDLNYPDRMLLAESNQWPVDVRPYFGDGDECHMAFHFPLMPRIFMALRQEDRHPITDILRQTPHIPDNCQWALFLRNHDELTLEMVTDEERDYMYSSYAADPRMRINIGIRRRLAPLMENSRRRIELLNSLLLSMHGTPVIYYGDEIGMGDNIYLGDRNGVRTPMQWSSDRNAGFSRADFAQLYAPPIMDPIYGYQSINVEAQHRDPSSLLNWMKRILALRNRYRKIFGRGSIEFVLPSNRKVLAYYRQYHGETILCIANLSRFVQPVELDLKSFKGLTPVEMIGHTQFPPIGDLPYFLTLGPHNFYWFHLTRAPEMLQFRVQPAPVEEVEAPVPMLTFSGDWSELPERASRILENQIFPYYLRQQRWYGGKSRKIQSVRIVDRASLSSKLPLFLFLVEVEYTRGPADTYVLPLTVRKSDGENPQGLVATIRGGDQEGLLCDAMADDAACLELFRAFNENSEYAAMDGSVRARSSTDNEMLPDAGGRVSRGLGEQSNTSVIFGDQIMMKLFRRLEPGPNPDYEILNYFSRTKRFDRVPKLRGVMEYLREGDQGSTIAILENVIANQGNAWDFTLDELGRYYERAEGIRNILPETLINEHSLFSLVYAQPPAQIADALGTYIQSAALIGKRTAEMHLALEAGRDDPHFNPEAFTSPDWNQLAEKLKNHATKVLALLRSNVRKLQPDQRTRAEQVLENEPNWIRLLESIENWEGDLMRIRIHGDYHLGQLLWVKNDFVILDFEGEPARNLSERRARHSVMKDIAGMIRSFSYAAYAGLLSYTGNQKDETERFEPWARTWQLCISAVFLREYLNTAGAASFLPRSVERFEQLTKVYLIDKMLYEVEYELNHRPEWVRIPLYGFRDIR